MAEPGEVVSGLTKAQKERMTRNRATAKAIREARLSSVPYETPGSRGARRGKAGSPGPSRPSATCEQWDTRGGFVLEREAEEEEAEQGRRRRRVVEEDGMFTVVLLFKAPQKNNSQLAPNCKVYASKVNLYVPLWEKSLGGTCIRVAP